MNIVHSVFNRTFSTEYVDQTSALCSFFRSKRMWFRRDLGVYLISTTYDSRRRVINRIFSFGRTEDYWMKNIQRIISKKQLVDDMQWNLVKGSLGNSRIIWLRAERRTENIKWFKMPVDIEGEFKRRALNRTRWSHASHTASSNLR